MDISILNAVNAKVAKVDAPSAWLGHLPFASWLIKTIEPKIFVELGVHYGHSYFSFCEGVLQGSIFTKCYGIDTWGGDSHTGKYEESIFISVNNLNEERYVDFSKLMRMTFDQASSNFEDGSIELLHIDGLHTYEAVKHDFETWLPKLAPNAIVLFHDTQVFKGDFGVWKFWNELQDTYSNNFEFLHSHGLGVIQINESPKSKKLNFLSKEFKHKDEFRQYFSRIAELALQEQELKRIASGIEDKDAYVNLQHCQIANLKAEIGVFDKSYKVFLGLFSRYLLRYYGVAKAKLFGKISFAGDQTLENNPQNNASLPVANLTRFEMITNQLRLDGTGIEIGPSYNPILPKRNGYSVTIVDHANAIDLKKKYATWGVDTSSIEDVDVIWAGGSLNDSFESSKAYDYIVASNVIEHIPNPILFLQDCEKLLKEDGKISLVIPDREFCFDYYQQLTTSGEWVEAYLQRHTHHPLRKHFNHFAYAAKRGEAIAWGEWTKEDLALQSHSLEKALEAAERQLASNEYFDTHGWYFSPLSFELIIRELGELGLINFKVIKSYPTYGFEFFVTLGIDKGNSSKDDFSSRSELVKKVFGRI